MQEMSDNCSHPLFRATAHALKNHDILCQIFEADRHVRPGDRLSSKDIVRCALASRAFCEPALRVLWRNMSSPAPLWRLLAASPYSTCEELTLAFINTILSKRTYTNPERWIRFMWYARFVEEFRIKRCNGHSQQGQEQEQLSQQKTLIDALVAHNGGESIFPSLQALWWSPSSDTELAMSYPLLTSTLRSAIFSFNRNQQADPVHTLLVRLRTSSPMLDYLCLSGKFSIGLNHCRVVTSFDHLTSLDITNSACITLTAFCELASMPGMKSLIGLEVMADGVTSCPIIEAPQLSFIAIDGTYLALKQLFGALRAPVLSSVSCNIIISGNPMIDHPDDASVQVIEALATVGSAATMDALYLSITLKVEVDDESTGMITKLIPLADLISPLRTTFRNIKTFNLSCSAFELIAKDDDFWALTRSWPKLQTFGLSQAYLDADNEEVDDIEGIDLPTPEVLWFFRDHCPDLRELSLPYLDLDEDVLSLSELSPQTRPPHELELLVFGASPNMADEHEGNRAQKRAEATNQWAHYILNLFPTLNVEKSLIDCESNRGASGWVQVLKRVQYIPKSLSDEGLASGDDRVAKPSEQ